MATKMEPKPKKKKSKILKLSTKVLKSKVLCREGLECLLELQKVAVNGKKVK